MELQKKEEDQTVKEHQLFLFVMTCCKLPDTKGQETSRAEIMMMMIPLLKMRWKSKTKD